MDELYHLHGLLLDADRFPLLVASILLCAVVGMISGPLAGNAMPFIWHIYAALFGKFGDRLDKKTRQRPDLMFRGFVICMVALLVALVLGGYVEVFIERFSYGGLVEVILLSLFLSAGAIWYSLLKLYFAMGAKDKLSKGAYFSIARTMRRNLNAGDDFAITRVALGLAARGFDKALIAPSLWYLIGGLPLVMVYSALAALTWRFGKDGFNTGFAAVPMALERLMGYVPSLFSALLLTLAASITPTAKLLSGISAWLGVKDRAPYEQGGAPLSALAWSLKLSLGGATQDISGSAIKAEWVGPKGSTARLEHKHLKRGIYINIIAHILFIASLLWAYMWSGFMG